MAKVIRLKSIMSQRGGDRTSNDHYASEGNQIIPVYDWLSAVRKQMRSKTLKEDAFSSEKDDRLG